MSILIKNVYSVSGELVTIFIKSDLIYSIGFRKPFADEVIEGEGKLVMPGIIDPHVHFRVPGGEHKEDWQTGSAAAAAGGVTTVLDMPNNDPPITSQEFLKKKKALIEGRSLVNYGLYMGATEDNLEEIKQTREIAGVKVYLGSSTGSLLVKDYTVVERLLKETDHIIAVHCEDEECLKKALPATALQELPPALLHAQNRPEECAKICAQKVLSIVKKINKPVYFCHVSSQSELEFFKESREQGLPLYIEATPHHLLYTCDDGIAFGNFAKVNPPLRSKESKQALCSALSEGLIDTIGTDHAPHTRLEKEKSYKEAPSGMPGIETSLASLLSFYHEGKVSLSLIQKCMSENPARIFNIQKRGKLEEGYYADLVVVDLHLTRNIKNDTLYTKCGWSAIAGKSLTGWPWITIVNGTVVCRELKITAQRYPGRDIFKNKSPHD